MRLRCCKPLFHAWERRLASVTTDRVVRDFDWGLDWIPGGRHGTAADRVGLGVMRDTDRFFTPPPTTDYSLSAPRTRAIGCSRFRARSSTPHPRTTRCIAGYFQARADRRIAAARAVLVLPQWNADNGGHVGLCRLLNWNGMSALRLSLPYHHQRMPPELHRADYIVSSNVARTVQVCRQAVLDARRAIAWLAAQGYERIGILGTSLGSCLALLTTAHEPLIRARGAEPHLAVLRRRRLARAVDRARARGARRPHRARSLRALWKPISPRWYLDRLRDRQTLLVYAKYDLTFPVDLSEDLVREFREQDIPHEVAVLPCGHYSTGKTPFKYLDGWMLTRFLKKSD